MDSIIAALALIAVGYIVGSVKTINQGNEALVERLGKYHKKLTPGLNFIVPFLDTIVLEESIRERVIDTEPQDAITRDNVSVTVDAVLYWRILQLERTYYAVEDVEVALRNLATTTLRSEIGRMELAQTFSSRNEINQSLLQQLDDATATWGVKVTRVEVQKIAPAKAVMDAMELERAAESKKKAAISEAEGKKRAAIEEAEGAVQSMNLLAEALRAHPNSREILRYLVAQRYVDANYRLGDSPNSKIVFMDPKALSEALGELISTEPPEGNGSGNGENGGGNGRIQPPPMGM
ncbi:MULTISPECIES: stomatin-like protein [unclassified Leptolyngbya]|uniref:SPFH domain-containing protein n=1 Tax=unclassified Leptolyngbya TaxID=2650499 RepID=UPI0016828E5F|nr:MULTISPECIES: stomatin-like protein [unclassified Leptolyngbya]MBD1910744.1 paraslipin [Leptolyngbya sp. FACHB-8]MBD2158237.1 paraslipin [Leptolyngbya sp. FACHB-16]